MNSIEHFIDGKITKGSSKKTSKIFNPATGEQTAEVNLASKTDVNLAVEKAKNAFVDWSRKPPGGNGQLQPDRPELPIRQRKGRSIGGIWTKKNGL